LSPPNKIIDISRLKVTCQDCTLTELCLPRGLDASEIEALDKIVKRRRPLRRGDYLFRAGDSFYSLYAVKAGSVKTFAPTDDGGEQILGFHLPGELVGLDAMQSDLHTCSAMALETTSVCELPFVNLEELSREVPGLQHQLFKLVGKEISNEHGMLLMLGNRSAEERLATFLLSLSSRLHERGFSAQEFNLSMSRHDIANYLGLAVETVSRLFTRFQEEGLLEVERRHITICDLDRLRSMVTANAAAGHVRSL
jgi:CRP/FNR family transcriptional regulator